LPVSGDEAMSNPTANVDPTTPADLVRHPSYLQEGKVVVSTASSAVRSASLASYHWSPVT